MLQLRLRLAMYKVQTNQIGTPLQNLQAKRWHNKFDIGQRRRPPFYGVFQQPGTFHAPQNLQYDGANDDEVFEEPELPSSPPGTEGEETGDDTVSTPRQKQAPKNPKTPTGLLTADQLKSPPQSESENEREEKINRMIFAGRNPTSSVVKGEAANGLLELAGVGR